MVTSSPAAVANGVPPDLYVVTQNLTKHYGQRITAVEDLNLTVRRGEIYGFLGPNGAGKTTTLRMLLGLIRPTSGSATVLGAAPGASAGLARVGALVESPAFYPYLSGRQNLRVLARYNGVSEARVDAVLAQVELTDRADDRFSTYSLGMKQRLGVAAALLKDPALLILDEPTNGLGPKGMAEMRVLIRQLGQGERTVLLSSHLLGEIEQICDRVGVIQHGRLIAENTVTALRGPGALLVRAAPLDRAAQLAATLPGVGGVQVTDGALRLSVAPEQAGAINRALVGADIEVSELRQVQESLEDVFLTLTEESGAAQPAKGAAEA
ncbi:MAG: ATP-binding cassette domain-containing protein [Thermomicrobiales bacterium]